MYMCVCVLGLVQLLVIPWTVAYQAPLWNFPDKNTGVGCYFLLPLPDPGVEPASPVSACTGRQIPYHRATWEALDQR